MAIRRTTIAVTWLCAAWVLPFACFTTGPDTPDGGDASDDATTDCGSFFGCLDAGPVIDPFGDAELRLRVRALLGGTSCQGQPEQACHAPSIHEGNTMLLVDLDAAGYATFGIINVPSSEVPDVLRVEPFHPESSYVYWKVSGDPRIQAGSSIMPASPGTVDPQIVALIGPWIEAGAP